MKELLKYAKNLELDFNHPDPNYRSKMDLAITSLVTGEYGKAKELFDRAIEIDSLFPSAWLGKTFAEIALVDDEGFNSINIDEYIERATKNNIDIINYKVAITGCLAYRHAAIIKKSILLVEEALKAAEEAKKKKRKAAATAVIGSAFVGKESSITSNIIGSSMIIGGTGVYVKAGLEEKEFEKLGKSLYAGALLQTYVSVPIIKLGETLFDRLENNDLKHNYLIVLGSWKDSVIYLYKKQREQLIATIQNLNLNDAVTIESLLGNPEKIQAIGEFKAFLKIVGLQNHKVFYVLDKLFKEQLPKYFNNPEAKAALEKAKTYQNISAYIGGGFVVIGILSLFVIGGSDNLEFIPWLIDSVGIGGGMGLYFAIVSKEMKAFTKDKNHAIKEIETTQITHHDFNLSLIETQNSTDNNRALDS